MKAKFLILILTILFLEDISAQYTPFFQNFSLSEYNAGNQNWGISRAENGMLYVANHNGLLEYDGIKWEFMELPNKTTIRSVLAYKDLVYTGSYEEFGYWKKNSKGKLLYKSLSDAIKSKISPNEEIWQIIPFKDGIAFRSFLNLYIYKFNGEIKKIAPKSVAISCSVVDNKLYVATLHNGVFEYKNDELSLKIMDKSLANTKVLSITKYKGKLLLITSLKGCLIYDSNTLKPVDFEINNILKQHLLNGFSLLNNGNMAFGTIKDGVYFTNSEGNVIFHINKENGLINNTVLSQHLDFDNKLWLGLDNGIASIDLDNNNLFFNDVSGKLGAVYDVIKFKGTIYIGSNTGLFYLDSNNNLQFITGSQGQVWNLKEIEGELFCGHNEGTFLVTGNTIKLISTTTGGWVVKKAPEQNNTYIQGTYTGLVRLKKQNNTWNAKHLGKTTMPIRYLVFENQNTAWAAHAYKGLYKIKFDKNYDTIISIKNYKNKGQFSDFNVRIYKIKNDICFKTNDGWLKYESIQDTIISFDLLNENFGKESYIISEEDINQLVLKTKSDAIGFKSILNSEKEISLSNNYFKNRLIVGNENISKISDSTFALNLNNGFMLINSKSNSKTELQKPIINNIEIDKSLIDFDLNKKIPIKLNSSFGISVCSPKSSNHFFEYSIVELDATKWKRLEKNKLELSSLKDGTYTILFRTNNNLGKFTEASKVQINILPPWYKDTLGFLLYITLIALSIGSFHYFNKQKLKKDQRLLKIKYAKEQQEIVREKNLENEKRIVQLKNESLRNEVKLKSKELANTALALVKKNETLQEIKKELATNKDGFVNQYAFKKILNKVDSSIGHKDEWKVFEFNFNQVHEDFFKSLKSKHQNLTPKDLKICAYVKMNLSNKEIAPLMNVSVRGLETHRYRLKKKLDLEDDISVSDYLINLE
ncbi:LuxR C-terminal-related transcriptional regulator [Mariniflexile sp.]|uniref:helix-turn-helix and ligand-binding sensor domain-containing protein n=1 Tax=Mariniflexile sp. TaxID=1979402 RepID=UPI003569A370